MDNRKLLTTKVVKKKSKTKAVVQKNTLDLAAQNLFLGRQIRDLRNAKGITLKTMAEHIQRSLGYVSQVERGVSALPIGVLKSISELLGVNISWFFHSDIESPLSELNYIVRGNNRRSLNFSGTGVSEQLLTPQLSSQLQMIMTTLAPKAKILEPRIRAGEEAGFVHSGSLELTIGEQTFLLNSGDSFSLNDKEQHKTYNPSATQETVIIWTLVGANY